MAAPRRLTAGPKDLRTGIVSPRGSRSQQRGGEATALPLALEPLARLVAPEVFEDPERMFEQSGWTLRRGVWWKPPPDQDSGQRLKKALQTEIERRALARLQRSGLFLVIGNRMHGSVQILRVMRVPARRARLLDAFLTAAANPTHFARWEK